MNATAIEHSRSGETEAIVIIKAAPQVGQRHGETVCCAAIDLQGHWLRLYPVSFRTLDDGQPVKKLRRSWNTAVKKAELEDVVPHALRHTRATWLMQAGTDKWQAAGHLGMSVEVLERVYGHHHPDWQKAAAEV